ncbi:anti-repressor SinI family protein [Peribacillus psychrosaccharolyticus]
MAELDQEWIQLIVDAKELGLSIDDIREFFLYQQKEAKKEVLSR